ncbi:hypothetical protein [Actinophytocola sp. NPDC049390]|uniref:hypothetical protein n=1 Tax=Actinophytocola sp. NPDC049390 TaxID=3363894 RepID=UPI0037BCCFC6
MSVLAYLHLHLAPAYDLVSTGAIHGVLLRGIAALGTLCAVAVLQFDHLAAHLAGLTASGVLTTVAATHGWLALPRYGPVILAAAAVAIAAPDTSR